MSVDEEDDLLDFKIKWKNEVSDVYGIPKNVSNNELFGMIFSELFEPEIKLIGKKKISYRRPRFTISKWIRSMKYEDNAIRGVLEMSNFGGEEDGGPEDEKMPELEQTVKQLEREKTEMEREVKDLKQTVKDRDRVISEQKAEILALKKKNLKKHSSIPMAISPSTIPRLVPQSQGTQTMVISRGVWVPVHSNFHFEENKRTSNNIAFSQSKKKAVGSSGSTTSFIGNLRFFGPAKYFFQVTVNVANGSCMRVGVLHGSELKNPKWCVESQEKGWSYDCYALEKCGVKSQFEDNNRGYGPNRKKGKYTIGVLVDFSDLSSKYGKVSFIVEGRNYGVAFKKVLPPVSPAFTLGYKGDSITIDQIYEVPKF